MQSSTTVITCSCFPKIKPHGTITKSDEEYTRRMVGCARLLEIDLLDHFFTSDIGEHYNMRSYNGRLFTRRVLPVKTKLSSSQNMGNFPK